MMDQQSFDQSVRHFPAVARPSAPPLKVPFGLKHDRMWSPTEVSSGKACGCVCPACGTALLAKAADSTHRRPHFAHCTDTDCRAGYETAIHRRAKQIIEDNGRVWLPAWDGDDEMPNPPVRTDATGQLVYGEPVEFPAREAFLTSVALEKSRGDYRPDVIAYDEHGEVLIEIRVSHAVEDLKRRRVQSDGCRMIEIDLSRLAAELSLDGAEFEQVVLDDLATRRWIACPEATEAWRESERALRAKVELRNAQIAQEQLRAAERQEQLAASLARRQERKGQMRANERARYQRELDALPDLVSPARVQALLRQYKERDGERADAMVQTVDCEVVRRELLVHHFDAWIYKVYPPLWQVGLYRHFIHGAEAGSRFNQRDAARWVMMRFGREPMLYQLFATQYRARCDARRAGIQKQSISYWVFTDSENDAIPDFYVPINDFIGRLVRIEVLAAVPGVRGEMQVR